MAVRMNWCSAQSKFSQSIRRNIFLALSLSLGSAVIGSRPVLADESLREVLFEDCDAARKKLEKIERNEEKELYPYLVRVLTLNTQAPDVPEAFAQLPNAPKGVNDVTLPNSTMSGDVSPGALWQTVDAKRELTAKRCALELLGMAGGKAAFVLPELATVYGEQNLSDEIGVEIEEVSAEIAEQAHSDGYSPSTEELGKVLAQLTSGLPLVALNYAQEFADAAAPRLLEMLIMGVPELESFERILRSFDREGDLLFRQFLKLAPSLEAAQLERVVATIYFPDRSHLPNLVEEIAQLAAGDRPHVAKVFAEYLGRACETLDGLSLSEGAQESLGKSAPLLSEGYIPAPMQHCLVGSVPALARRVPFLIFPSEPKALPAAFSLLEAALPLLNNEERNDTYAQLKQAAGSGDPSAAVGALDLLRSFPEKRTETLAFLATLVKEKAISAEPSSVPIRNAILSNLRELAPGKDSSHFVQFALSSLAIGSPAGIVCAVLPNDAKIESELVSMSEKGPANAMSGALMALGRGGFTGKKASKRLTDSLNDTRLIGAARKALIEMGSVGTAAVRAALPKSPRKNRGVLLSLLEGYDSASRAESIELMGLLADDSCEELAEAGHIVVSLLKKTELAAERPRSALASKVAECLPSVRPSTGRLWIETIATIALSSEASVTAITSSTAEVPTETYTALMELLLRGGLPGVQSSEVISEMLTKGSSAVKIKVLQSLDPSKDSTGGVVSQVRKLAEDKSSPPDIRLAAQAALARSKVMEYDWKEFIDKAIDSAAKGEDVDSTVEVIKNLPASVILEEILPALESKTPAQIRGAARIGAVLGPEAAPIVSQLWLLRDDRAPSVRFSALLALLEINPLFPDLQEHVRKLLVNRYFTEALDRDIEWHASVAFIELKRENFGRLRRSRLSALLQKKQVP